MPLPGKVPVGSKGAGQRSPREGRLWRCAGRQRHCPAFRAGYCRVDASYELSMVRFGGEGLTDGVVSVLTAGLTLVRRTNPGDFPAALKALEERMVASSRQMTYFARGHRFTEEAVGCTPSWRGHATAGRASPRA